MSQAIRRIVTQHCINGKNVCELLRDSITISLLHLYGSCMFVMHNKPTCMYVCREGLVTLLLILGSASSAFMHIGSSDCAQYQVITSMSSQTFSLCVRLSLRIRLHVALTQPLTTPYHLFRKVANAPYHNCLLFCVAVYHWFRVAH